MEAHKAGLRKHRTKIWWHDTIARRGRRCVYCFRLYLYYSTAPTRISLDLV